MNGGGIRKSGEAESVPTAVGVTVAVLIVLLIFTGLLILLVVFVRYIALTSVKSRGTILPSLLICSLRRRHTFRHKLTIMDNVRFSALIDSIMKGSVQSTSSSHNPVGRGTESEMGVVQTLWSQREDEEEVDEITEENEPHGPQGETERESSHPLMEKMEEDEFPHQPREEKEEDEKKLPHPLMEELEEDEKGLPLAPQEEEQEKHDTCGEGGDRAATVVTSAGGDGTEMTCD